MRGNAGEATHANWLGEQNSAREALDGLEIPIEDQVER